MSPDPWKDLTEQIPLLVASVFGGIVSVVAREVKTIMAGFSVFLSSVICGVYGGPWVAAKIGVEPLLTAVVLAIIGNGLVRRLIDFDRGGSLFDLLAAVLKIKGAGKP